MSNRRVLSGAGFPLELGKEREIIKETVTGSGTCEIEFTLLADTVLFAVDAISVSGTLKVDVYTESTDGQQVNIIEYPTLTAATTSPLLRKAASSLQKIVVKIVHSDDCSFIVRARGTAIGEASFRILGANNLDTAKILVGTTTQAIIASSLTDRATVALRNNSNTAIMEIAGTAAKVDSGDSWPLGPGEVVVVDIQAGQLVYGKSNEANTDVRILETGG